MKYLSLIHIFAQTLALGIVVSMFTALVITRMIVYAFYAVGIRNPKLYGRIKEERAPIDFLGKRKIFFAVSVAMIASTRISELTVELMFSVVI